MINVNDAPDVPMGDRAAQEQYAQDIRAAIIPGPVEKPAPLDEARVAAILLPDGTPDLEAQQALREKHQREEEAFTAYQVNRNGNNRLDNLPNGSPGPELKALVSDALQQLKKDGFLR